MALFVKSPKKPRSGQVARKLTDFEILGLRIDLVRIFLGSLLIYFIINLIIYFIIFTIDYQGSVRCKP